MKRFLRPLLMACGVACVALGMLGLFLPVIPTTPFLLLAAVCFSRSSDRLYRWLTENRLFGGYIRDYRAGRGIPLRAKVMAIGMIWLTVLPTSIFVIPLWPVKVTVLAIAAAVTAYLLRLPTAAPISRVAPGNRRAAPREPRFNED